jgi:SAM-dependent methyltransferase
MDIPRNQLQVLWNKGFGNFILKTLKTYNITLSKKQFEKMIAKKNDIDIYLELFNCDGKSSHGNYNQNRAYQRKKDILIELNLLDNNKILDIGCENVKFLDVLNGGDNTDVIGINIDDRETFMTGYHDGNNRKSITTYDGVNFPYEDNTFDVILCYMTIHHMTDYKKTFMNATKLLKPGGHLLIYEHDITTQYQAYFIDFIHFLHELVLNDKFNSEYYSLFVRKYVNRQTLIDNFTNAGYIHQPTQFDNISVLQRKFHLLFQKSK